MKLRVFLNTLRARQSLVVFALLLVLLVATIIVVLVGPKLSSGMIAMGLLASMIIIELFNLRHGKWAKPFFAGARALRRGDYERAEEALDRALAAADRFGKLDPRRGMTLDMLVSSYIAQSRYELAEPLCRKALALKRQIWPPDHREMQTTMVNLGLIYVGRARFADALPLLEEALAILDRSNARSLNRGIALNNLGKWYSDQLRYQEALGYYERALAFFKERLRPTHEFVGLAYTNVGLIDCRLGRLEEAEIFAEKGLAIFRGRFQAEHPYIAVALNNLAEIQGRRGKLDDALDDARRSLKIRERIFGPDHLSVSASLTTLASLHRKEGKYDLAETLCRRALRIREDVLPAGHPALVEPLEILADVLHHLDSPTQAEAYAARANAIRARFLGPEPEGIALAVPSTDGGTETAIRAEAGQHTGIKPGA